MSSAAFLFLTLLCKLEIISNKLSLGFPGGSDGKESVCNAGRNWGLISESGRYPGKGNCYLLQYSCLGYSMDRGARWATVMGSQRAGHDWATNTHIDTHTHIHIHTQCL